MSPLQTVLLTFKERIPLRQIERLLESFPIVRLRWASAPADILTYCVPHYSIERIAANDPKVDKCLRKDVWPPGRAAGFNLVPGTCYEILPGPSGKPHRESRESR